MQPELRKMGVKCEIYRDSMQNYKKYGIPKAQLIIADVPKIHPAQKPVAVLKKLIEIFTDPGDVVIDPCAGSGSTLRAAVELGRSAYGFEIDRNFYQQATGQMLVFEKDEQLSIFDLQEGVMP